MKQLGPKLYANFSAVRRHLAEQLVHRMDLTRVELSHRRERTHLLCMVEALTGTAPQQCRQRRHDTAEHANAEEGPRRDHGAPSVRVLFVRPHGLEEARARTLGLHATVCSCCPRGHSVCCMYAARRLLAQSAWRCAERPRARRQRAKRACMCSGFACRRRVLRCAYIGDRHGRQSRTLGEDALRADGTHAAWPAHAPALTASAVRGGSTRALPVRTLESNARSRTVDVPEEANDVARAFAREYLRQRPTASYGRASASNVAVQSDDRQLTRTRTLAPAATVCCSVAWCTHMCVRACFRVCACVCVCARARALCALRICAQAH